MSNYGDQSVVPLFQRVSRRVPTATVAWSPRWRYPWLRWIQFLVSKVETDIVQFCKCPTLSFIQSIHQVYLLKQVIRMRQSDLVFLCSTRKAPLSSPINHLWIRKTVRNSRNLLPYDRRTKELLIHCARGRIYHTSQFLSFLFLRDISSQNEVLTTVALGGDSGLKCDNNYPQSTRPFSWSFGPWTWRR